MNFEAVATRPEAEAKGSGEAPPKISCRRLDFYYGKFQGLKDINLDVADGRVTACFVVRNPDKLARVGAG